MTSTSASDKASFTAFIVLLLRRGLSASPSIAPAARGDRLFARSSQGTNGRVHLVDRHRQQVRSSQPDRAGGGRLLRHPLRQGRALGRRQGRGRDAHIIGDGPATNIRVDETK